jgi:hypothetical protein
LQKVHNEEAAELAKLRSEIANFRGKPGNVPVPDEVTPRKDTNKIPLIEANIA